jgi:hypothetical protein
MSATVIKIHDAMRDADARTLLLVARIGKDDTSASGEGGKSVWDTICRSCDTMDEVQKHAEFGAKELIGAKEHAGVSQCKMENMRQNLIGLKQHVTESIGVTHRKTVGLEKGPTEWKVGDPGVDTLSGSLEPERLKRRLDELKGQARPGRMPDVISWGAPENSRSTLLSHSEEWTSWITRELTWGRV